MKILYGIQDGALLQRDSDGCCCVTVAFESKGTPSCSLGSLKFLRERDGMGFYTFSGIKAGGPYTVRFSDEDSTETLTVWVGDLWILAGQSNMEGAGRPDKWDINWKTNPDPEVRAYYLDNRWEEAVPILHEPWMSVDACQKSFFEKYQLNSVWKSKLPPHLSHGKPEIGVCPGLFFALRMKEITGVPQGVIPCALGGSHLRMWARQDTAGDNLYAAMLRRFIRTGSHVRGVLWHQGEAQTGLEDAQTYEADMVCLVNSIRQDFNAPALPFIMAQIAGTSLPCFYNDVAAKGWEIIREKQRTLEDRISHLTTVSTVDCSRDDQIHLSSAGQKKLGFRFAEGMAYVLGIGGSHAPIIKKVDIEEDEYKITYAVLKIEFDHAVNLNFSGRPQGFCISDSEYGVFPVPAIGIGRIAAQGNTVYLHTEYTLEQVKTMYLRYGCGVDPYCNLTDANGQAALAMGPLKIEDYI